MLKLFKELQSLSPKDLVAEKKKNVTMFRKLRFENRQGSVKDSSQLKKLRKYVARMNTIETQRKKQLTSNM